MCGINGFNWKDEILIEGMNRVTKHSGPDDEGVYIDNRVSLGHVMLSIIDLPEKGHKPMSDTNKKIHIMHNGEVYNFEEIRKELERLGYRFTSKTDTEVVLYSFIEWGEKCLEKFNGMFAFVIYDKEGKKLIIVRDRIGIKLLYYFLRWKTIHFLFRNTSNINSQNILNKINNKYLAIYNLPTMSNLVILVFMGLGKNNCYSILKPLSMQEDVSQIHVVRDSEGPEIPKVRYHVVPESIRKYSRLKVFYRLLLGFFLLTRKNFDFILSTYIQPHFFLSLILSTVFRKKRVHILINEAETCLHITNLWLESRLERFLVECLNRNTLTLVRSSRMIDLFAAKGIERDKLMHLPHFLDMTKFSNQHRDRECDVVVVSRVEPVKRLDRLLDAISEIKKTKPDISVTIVGAGSLEDELKPLTESKNLSENIVFQGFIPPDRIPDVWNKGKIYILTSENEGGPLALFEAMACGVVPVATGVGNAPDLIRHGINGYLVGDPDDIGEYTGYALELLNNQDKLERMSCEAEKIRKNYDLSCSMEKWRTILSKIK